MNWLNIRLGTMGNLIPFFCTLLQTLSTLNGNSSFMSPQDLSLAITYATSVPMLAAAVIGQLAMLEAGMSSVERVKHYCDTIESEECMSPEEADAATKSLPADWPSKVYKYIYNCCCLYLFFNHNILYHLV